MKHIAIALTALVFTLALAQNYSGTYVMQGQKGPVTLTLQQSEEGVQGVLQGGGVSFKLEGAIDKEGVYGVVYSEQGELYFEMVAQGDKLQLTLAPFDAEGNPDPDRAVQYLMTRQAGAGGGNPLAAPRPSGGSFAGSYAGDGLTVVFEGSGGQYSGQIVSNGQTYPLRGEVSGGVMQGQFQSGGQSYPFAAKLDGGVLLLQAGNQTYRLQRRAASGGNHPLGGNQSVGSGGQVIARGQYAELTLDNAMAFIEALEFSLQQLGRQVSYGQAEKQQLLEALIKAYPQGGKQEQVILSRARRIWTNAQANWAQTPVADKRAFITDVLVLAFGEQTARQLIAEATGNSGGGAGGVSADTMGAWGEVSSDISNTTGCWGSNGCSYDSSTNSYDYSADYYSDDY